MFYLGAVVRGNVQVTCITCVVRMHCSTVVLEYCITHFYIPPSTKSPFSPQSHLKEVEASMDQTQTVWHMQLDHQRNRVLRMNLLMSMASFGAMTMTVPAAFFGMNLENTLETVPGVFGFVVKCSLVTGLLVSSLMYAYYKFGPKRRYKARLRDMRSLR